MLAAQVSHLQRGWRAGHALVVLVCVSRQYCTTLSRHLLRKTFVMLHFPCYEFDYRGPTALQHSKQEWAGVTHRNKKKKQTTDVWTHRNYLKGGYREDVVTLFSGKGWGLIDTRRNVSITCKENITWLVWPAMGASAQRSCGLSILGGNANTAGWGPEQNRELQSRPCFELGNAVHDLQRSF